MNISKGPWKFMAPLGEGLPAVLAETVTPYGNFYIAQCNREEDARFIACAPELLEKLKMALDVLENMTSEEFSRGADLVTRQQIRDAIDRAEGTRNGRETNHVLLWR